MQIERQIVITYRWWNDKENLPSPVVQEVLDNKAKEHISEMINAGYTSGELCEQSYSGHWEMNTKTL